MDTVKAVVQSLYREGKHGPYAVASSEQLDGSVTFSLQPTVWKEKDWPEGGMSVFLGELREKRAGWRAKTARFWRPSDEQIQQRARSSQMKMLYPLSEQFPFDPVCAQIVHELEKRNWQVPGIKVEFDDYGRGRLQLRRVQTIEGKDFRLWFCRVQGRILGTGWNDIAAVCQINIPGKELSVHEDESGPTLHLYVGKNWARDRHKFVHGGKVNSKLNGDPRTYLTYSGGCDCEATAGAAFGAVSFLTAFMTRDAEKLAALKHTHPGRRSPLLVHDNDLGREYDPKRGEPTFFRTEEVFEEFRKYLEKIVLARILAHPLPGRQSSFRDAKKIPFPESIGPIFCLGDWKDEKRIRKGKENPQTPDLPIDECYGMLGSGYRLVPLDVPFDRSFPKTAYDGFLWARFGEVTPETKIQDLEFPGGYHCPKGDYVIRVTPRSANGIFVADQLQYEMARNATFGGKSKNYRATNAEFYGWLKAAARTLIPITEYQGNYSLPVVLIKRELGFDEVEVVSGPHKNSF